MRAIIVGAGIAGLAAAIALRRADIDVTIIERAPALTEAGAGVVLGPHAMRVLHWLGADEHVKKTDVSPERMLFHDLISGNVINRTELGEAGIKRFGAPFYVTHRRDLIDALAGQLKDVDIRLNCRVTSVKPDESGVDIVSESGDIIRGDFLVGADGLRSTVRAAVFGDSEAASTGLLAWRTISPMELLPRKLPPETRIWSGAGRHVVAYPIRQGKQFYAAFYVPAHEVRREDWAATGDVAELRKSFKDACPAIREIADAVTEAFITAINYRSPLETWHRGRTVLVGDAAHPVLPTSGSGAAMALEDSVALSFCLSRNRTDLEAAFAEFQTRRRPRTTRLLYQSRGDLTAFHEEDLGRQAAYGRMNRGMLQLDPGGAQRFAWLYGHDEVAESGKRLGVFLESKASLPVRPAAARAYKLWAEALNSQDEDWISERAAYERLMTDICPWPDDVSVEQVNCDGVPALRVVPRGFEHGPAVLHLHGGGYVFGSAKTSVAIATGIARAIAGWALVPDFRLAPESSAAQIHDDIRRAYGWLTKCANRVMISGECSGGNLAVNLAVHLRDHGQQTPAALYLLSPFADLALTADSIDRNGRMEPWMTRRRLLSLAGAFLQDRDACDPLMSSVRTTLHGLPPLLVAAASNEALVDDARALVTAVAAAGGHTNLHLVQDSVHSFALFDFLPEASAFFGAVRDHARSILETGRLPGALGSERSS